MNFFAKVTIGVAAVILVAVGAIQVLRNPEAAKIEKVLREGADWAAAGQAEKCISLISKEFRTPAEDYEAVCSHIRRRVQPGRLTEMKVRSADVHVEGDTARVVFSLRVDLADLGFSGTTVVRLELRMRKESGGWKIVSYQEMPGF